MLLLLLSALTLLLASEDLVCDPFLSEFSTLRFRTTADLQYIELAVMEECRSNVQAMKVASYGLSVLNTKSPLCLDLMGLTTSRFFEGIKTFRKDAIVTGNGDCLTALHVRRHMIFHGLCHRSYSDIIKHKLERQKKAKPSIFEISSKSAVVSSSEL